MRAIDDVRTFFMQSAGEEEKIVQILQIFLEKIDKKNMERLLERKKWLIMKNL